METFRKMFSISELPELEGIDQLAFYGGKQLISTFKGWHQALQQQGYCSVVSCGIDVFKPMRNKITLAYFALTGGNYTLVGKNELNDLMADAGKLSVGLVTQEVYIVKADGSVTTNGSGCTGE